MTTFPAIGLIGFGAIGEEIFRATERLGELDRLAAILVRPGRVAPCAVNSLDDLIGKNPVAVIECAGHEAARSFVPALLDAGIDCILSSVGALSDPAFASTALAAERRGGGLLLLPAGAIAGLDGLAAAALAGIASVSYSSYKPPHAWHGTPAEDLVDLEDPASEQVFFEGSARDAARLFPQNANVAVAVGLAGIGLDRTMVRLIASRRETDPRGIITAEGAFGRFTFDILALASATNPKTSALTAYSLLQCARLGNAMPVFAMPGSTSLGASAP